MGMFKNMKDMRSMVSAAPGLIDQANHMAANAQLMQQSQAKAYHPSSTMGSAPAGVFEPIAGVELATFAQVSAGLAQYGYDQSKAVGLAAMRGIDSVSWQEALEGWNQRIASHPAVAQRFNTLNTGRG